MKKLFYEDCNNNGNYISKLIKAVQALSIEELVWDVSNLEILSLPQRDYIVTSIDSEIEQVYEFEKKFSKEHNLQVSNKELLKKLEYTKTIYYGNFKTKINHISLEPIIIKVFDGDIFEISDDLAIKINI